MHPRRLSVSNSGVGSRVPSVSDSGVSSRGPSVGSHVSDTEDFDPEEHLANLEQQLREQLLTQEPIGSRRTRRGSEYTSEAPQPKTPKRNGHGSRSTGRHRFGNHRNLLAEFDRLVADEDNFFSKKLTIRRDDGCTLSAYGTIAWGTRTYVDKVLEVSIDCPRREVAVYPNLTVDAMRQCIQDFVANRGFEYSIDTSEEVEDTFKPRSIWM